MPFGGHTLAIKRKDINLAFADNAHGIDACRLGHFGQRGGKNILATEFRQLGICHLAVNSLGMISEEREHAVSLRVVGTRHKRGAVFLVPSELSSDAINAALG